MKVLTEEEIKKRFEVYKNLMFRCHQSEESIQKFGHFNTLLALKVSKDYFDIINSVHKTKLRLHITKKDIRKYVNIQYHYKNGEVPVKKMLVDYIADFLAPKS